MRTDTGDLDGVKFAVLALGDTAFDLFCEAGKQWDEVLESKGASRVNERLDCDTDYDDYAYEWIEETRRIRKRSLKNATWHTN